MSRYALVNSSNVVINIAEWDGSTTWNKDPGTSQTIVLNSGEECGIGYTYVSGGTPRFTAPPTYVDIPIPVLDDAEYLVATSRTKMGSGRLTVNSTSVTVDTGKSGEIEFRRAALTGDVTASANSNATTIANDAVTFAKMQNVATNTLLGRATSGTGDVETITCTAAGRAILDDADASEQRTTLGLGTVATESTVPISKGGTGQTTKTAAFDALSPQTSKGDFIAFDGTNAVRLAVGATNGHVLTVDSTTATGIKWAAASGGSTATLNVQEFHLDSGSQNDSTWEKPTGAQLVIAIGSGGGGGGQVGTTTTAGQGGAAGAAYEVAVQASRLGATEAVTIGAGGGSGAVGSDTTWAGFTWAGGLTGSNGNLSRGVVGATTTNGYGAGGQSAGSGGRHGGWGAGGGGGGHTTAAGTAGGKPRSFAWRTSTATDAAAGGGAAGGTTGGGAGTAANSANDIDGFGEGGGGGGFNAAGAGGNGGAGRRGSGGGGGGQGTTAGGTGGAGGGGYLKIITICW